MSLNEKTVFGKEILERFSHLIAEPKKVVIVAHANPDGDAIGSSLAMGEWLEKRGHDVTCIVPNRYPSFLEWMPMIDKLRIFKLDKEGLLATRICEAELIFCMDFNMVARMEGLGEIIMSNENAKFVLVDHHQDPPDTFDVSFSFTDFSSTSYIVYKLIDAVEGSEAISRDMATNLYVGMMTDTGNFSFSNLTPDLFETVADIARKGVDIPQVYSNVYNNFSEDRIRLLGFAISKMVTMQVNGVGIAYITLSEAEMRRYNFRPGDSEGFVNVPLTIGGMTFAAIFIQTRQFIRVSLRSRGDVDVSKFARQYFEGGGHKNASGGKSFRSLPETVAYFRKSVTEFFGGAEDRCTCRDQKE